MINIHITIEGIFKGIKDRSYESKKNPGKMVRFYEINLLNPQASDSIDSWLAVSASDSFLSKFNNPERQSALLDKRVILSGSITSYNHILRVRCDDLDLVK